MMLRFRLNTIPTAQARTRHRSMTNKRGKTISVAYKAKSQKANERVLEDLLKLHAPAQPIDGPLVLEFVAALPVPESDSKKKRAEKLAGLLPPSKKPDIDNVTKQLMDAMTRQGFWKDDVQVVELHCRKVYAQQGYIDVMLHTKGGAK